MGSVWTSEMVDFLKKSYKAMTDRGIATHLGVGVRSVTNKRSSLGLFKSPPRNARIVWNSNMVDFLRRNYKKMIDKEIASKLGIPVTSVTNKRQQLGLAKDRRKKPKDKKIVYPDREKGQLGNLKGSIFNLACQIHVHQKYPFLFRFSPLPTYRKGVGTDVRQTVSYACEDEETYRALSSLFPRASPLWPEEAGDWRLRGKHRKARRSGRRNRKSGSTKRRINRMLKREEEYRYLTSGFSLEPDFVVFTTSEIHIYEFKFSGQGGLTREQRKFIRFLRKPSEVLRATKMLYLEDFTEGNSSKKREERLRRVKKIKAKFFILRPADDFLRNVRIESQEMP